MQQSNNKIFIVCGPSGVGKKTLLSELVKIQKFNLAINVSHTTRAPRDGEEDGKDYYFITKEKFEELIKNDDFLEHAYFFGQYYGTHSQTLENLINEGKNVILEIETDGFNQLKSKLNGFVSIFIYPPSMDNLKTRLEGRETEEDQEIRTRLEKGEKEMEEISQFQYKVLNDSIERSLSELVGIFNKELGLVEK
ncbi:guanylate kinase [Mycoplasma wenyonii str. Massachusetts]|uniref:Guanylate kinase n=1 Tax=Mycoplasma wenyonii (strain Massachusetts) TaxID=1197325 RepID=I6ZEF7_MYCWM|nr:guanylate kinase [Mycoplasma wenyonii]AFN64972.1 guanylate kinase [Mycoplasma wenyonii str. Massachusetts]